jgi:hypothetical protein
VEAVYTLIVIVGVVYVLRTAFGGGRALRRRVETSEGASGTTDELVDGGDYVKLDCGFEMKRPDRFSAQTFCHVYVSRSDIVLAERGVAYRIDRANAVVEVSKARIGRKVVVRSPTYEARLSPVSMDDLVAALASVGWLGTAA